MKSKKYIGIWILTLFILVVLSNAATAPATVVSVSPSTQSVDMGETFTVDIRIDPSVPIAGAQFDLSFNPALVNADSVTEGDLLKQGGADTYFSSGKINNTAGTITKVFGVPAPKQTVSSPGVFVTIHMTAKSVEGSSILNLSNVKVGDKDAKPVSITVNNGNATIVAPTHTEVKITSCAPETPVHDIEGATRTFNVTVNQTVNVSWQINGTAVQHNESVTEAAYTNTSAAEGTWNVTAVASNPNGTAIQTWIWRVGTNQAPIASLVFDTGTGTYPSVSGTHNGTITPNVTIEVSKLYTYPCAGTGGHTEYVIIANETGVIIAEADWDGYHVDRHNISFDVPFTLVANETYNYSLRTGSYPQIIHAPSKTVAGGTITCDKFLDANGNTYTDWIPAIRLGQ